MVLGISLPGFLEDLLRYTVNLSFLYYNHYYILCMCNLINSSFIRDQSNTGQCKARANASACHFHFTQSLPFFVLGIAALTYITSFCLGSRWPIRAVLDSAGMSRSHLSSKFMYVSVPCVFQNACRIPNEYKTCLQRCNLVV